MSTSQSHRQYRRRSDRLGTVTVPPRDCSECGNYYDEEPHAVWCSLTFAPGYKSTAVDRYRARSHR